MTSEEAGHDVTAGLNRYLSTYRSPMLAYRHILSLNSEPIILSLDL